MNKRSATLIAASLVGVLAIAGAAFALGITGPTASAASEQTTAAATKPIVRTHTKTVVVHRQAAAPAPVVVQAAPSTSSPSPSMSGDDGSHHDNEGRDDHGDDENEGPDDHGDHGNEGPTITATTMTDAPRPRKKRWSKRAVRATAWTAGAAAFFSALGAFGAAAIPVATDQASHRRPRPVRRSSSAGSSSGS